MYSIETSDLTKYYGPTRGIENLNLQIKSGEIYGFLGPNGAGKSTTIRLLLKLLLPTRGTFRIFGKDTQKKWKEITGNLSNVPGEIKMYEDISGAYFLNFMSRLSGKPAPLKPELLEAFRLSSSDLQRKIKYYSRGMKQKLAIIQAMQDNPQLLIMDEPSEGLDPLNKEVLYEFLRRFRNEGKTIFFSSHNLPEVEKICDRVGLVRDGKLITEEPVGEFSRKTIRKMTIRFRRKINCTEFDSARWTVVECIDRNLTLLVSGDINPLLKKLSEYEIENLIFPEPSLEETFMKYYN